MANDGLAAAIASMLSFSGEDTASKQASVNLGNYLSALVIVGAGVIPLLISVAFIPQTIVTPELIMISLAAGFFLSAGYVLVYKSLETEQTSNVWILYSIVPASTVLFGALALKEPISTISALCIVVVFFGAILVSMDTRLKFNRLLLPAFLGYLCWIAYNLLLIYAISYNGTASTGVYLTTRIAGFALLLVYCFVMLKPARRKFGIKNKMSLLPAIVAGLLDGIAYVAFVYVVKSHFVAIGSAILAMEFAVVVLLGHLIYKDRLTRLQALGFVISLAGSLALALLPQL